MDNHSTELCQGNSIHECKICGEPFLCYWCPDDMNPYHAENICFECLHKALYGKLPKED